MDDRKRPSWDILRDYLGRQDFAGLNEYLSGLSGEESLRALMRLEPAEQQEIFERMTPGSAAEVVEFMTDESAAEILGELNPEVAGWAWWWDLRWR